MILRRLADGIRNQDWFTVLVEVLIVVVGIFLGLQVDDWNEARKDRAEESTYLARLVDDLDASILLTQDHGACNSDRPMPARFASAVALPLMYGTWTKFS